MTQGQGEGKVKLHTMNLVAVSSYRHGICLSFLLKIWWGIHNTFLDCSLPSGGGKKVLKIPWNFGQFRSAHGTGSGLTEDQWYFGPLLTR